MVRSSPSASDGELLAALADAGQDVSHFQLERWRQRGLLPRPILTRHPRRGTQVAPPARIDFQAAMLLSEHAGRGHSWQLGGCVLFEDGFRLTEPSLRECASWLIHRPYRTLATIWNHATTALRTGSLEPADALGDVAELAASLTRRHRTMGLMFRNVRRDLERLGYERDSLDDAAHLALGLRLADIVGVELSPRLAHVAKYGSDDAPLPDYPFALHSEKLRCISTMSLREAYLYRSWTIALYALEEYPKDLFQSAFLLDLVVIGLSNRRAGEPPFLDAAQPLSHIALLDLERSVVELEAEAREVAGLNAVPDQPTLF